MGFDSRPEGFSSRRVGLCGHLGVFTCRQLCFTSRRLALICRPVSFSCLRVGLGSRRVVSTSPRVDPPVVMGVYWSSGGF